MAMLVMMVLSKPQKFPTNTLANLGVTYSTDQQVSANTNSPHTLLTVHQCDGSTGTQSYAVLSIITKDNYQLNINESYPAVEISNVAGVFNSSTIIGCNYNFDNNIGAITKIYNNITWKYPYNGDQQIYIRMTAINSQVSVTFQLSYTNYASEQLGKRDSRVFNNIIYETAPYAQSFSQYVKLSGIGSVFVNAYYYYYIQFCKYEITKNDYQVIATVTSDPSSPLSAFDVLFCPKSQVNDFENCNLNNFNIESKNQCACSVSQVTFDNDNDELEQGAYVAVIGEGSPPDGYNKFMLSVTLKE